MELIDTAEGPIERSKLAVKDIIAESQGVRSIATEWYFEGRMVRRDAWINIVSTH